MAAQQSSQENKDRSGPAKRKLGLALLGPLAAVLLGVLLLNNSLDTSADLKSQERPAAGAPPATASEPPPSSADLALPRSVPKRLSIPVIDVDAPFTPLPIGESGQLDVPPRDNDNLVGWFEGGATPGERGSSIVVGHLDTKTGPAVFARLSTLTPGVSVAITREDGSVATFKVDSVETFSKTDFPDERVYADTPSARLRLITCAGAYDKKAENYEDNVVVFAHLDSVEPA